MARVVQDFAPKTVPLPHQIEAIRYLVEHPNGALFDEQGLGKTKVVIDALCVSMAGKEIEAALIVAPLSLLYVWEQELSKHSHLIPMVLRGDGREKRYRLLTGANFYIINYEAIVAETERIRRFCRSRRFAIVLDEAARLKDPRTKTAEALFELAPLAKKRIIITGTPVANKPVDLWSQFFFLDSGKLLGPSYKVFQSECDEKRPDYSQRLMELREKIGRNSIRRTKDGTLELPEKTFVTVAVELGGRQLQLYDELREQLWIEITALDGNTIIDEAENVLKKLLRLTQLASNPALVDRAYKETPAKFPVVDGLVDEAVTRGEKVIVWSSFVDNVSELANRFRKHKALVIHGEVPPTERADVVQKFQRDIRHRVLVANPAAAREGLTLTEANNAVYVDRNFNLTDYLQSQDRIHRISQQRRCLIYKVIARGTIDEYVDRILELKADVARFVEGDVTGMQPNTLHDLVNKRELLRLLGG